MGDSKIIKFRRIYQTLFYLCQFKTRDEICEKNTARLDWKKVRGYFRVNSENVMDDNIYKQMKEYNPFGPKDFEFTEYHKL